MATKDLFELLRRSREKQEKQEKKEQKKEKKKEKKEKKERETQSAPPLFEPAKIEDPSSVDEEEEIYEAEEFPLEEIYYSKTYTFRFDTLIMAGALGGVLLVVTFFLGRLSVGSADAVPPGEAKEVAKSEKEKKTPPALSIPGEKKDKGESQKGEKEETKTPTPESKYVIQVLTSPNRKGAQKVVDFLKSKGYPAYIHPWRSSFQVRVKGFETMDKSALRKIKNLKYRGRKWFSTALFIRVN